MSAIIIKFKINRIWQIRRAILFEIEVGTVDNLVPAYQYWNVWIAIRLFIPESLCGKLFETYELHGPTSSRLSRSILRGCLVECANTMKIKNITFRDSLIARWINGPLITSQKGDLIQFKWSKTSHIRKIHFFILYILNKAES